MLVVDVFSPPGNHRGINSARAGICCLFYTKPRRALWTDRPNVRHTLRPCKMRPARASSFFRSSGSPASGAVINALSRARSEPIGHGSCSRGKSRARRATRRFAIVKERRRSAAVTPGLARRIRSRRPRQQPAHGLDHVVDVGEIAAQLGQEGIPVKIGHRPRSWPYPPAGSGHVKHYINYYVSTGMRRTVVKSPQYRGNLRNVDVARPGIGHFNIDKAAVMEDEVMRDINAALIH
jgi:hypothetical protein